MANKQNDNMRNLCIGVIVAIVVYSAIAPMVLPVNFVSFMNTFVMRLVLFSVVALTSLYNPCLGILVLLAVLATLQCFCYNEYMVDMTLEQGQEGYDKMQIVDNFPQSFENNYHNRASHDKYDNMDPHDNFYPSFVNEIQNDSRSMRNNESL